MNPPSLLVEKSACRPAPAKLFAATDAWRSRLNGANPYDDLSTLQRHAGAVKDNPSQWLPWNYTETAAALAPD